MQLGPLNFMQNKIVCFLKQAIFVKDLSYFSADFLVVVFVGAAFLVSVLGAVSFFAAAFLAGVAFSFMPESLACFESWAFLRAAVFLLIRFFLTALSISD